MPVDFSPGTEDATFATGTASCHRLALPAVSAKGCVGLPAAVLKPLAHTLWEAETGGEEAGDFACGRPPDLAGLRL